MTGVQTCALPILVQSGVVSAANAAQALRAQQKVESDSTVDNTLRVRMDKLDKLIDTVSELVIAQSMVAQDGVIQDGAYYDLTKWPINFNVMEFLGAAVAYGANHVYFDATAGIAPWSSALVLLQSFSIVGTGDASGAYRRFELSKVQLSITQSLFRGFSLQVGGVAQIAGGHNIPGVIVAIWWHH